MKSGKKRVSATEFRVDLFVHDRAVAARGEDLTTTAGKTFHDIQVLSRNSTSLLIQSREGEFNFSLSELKPADREKFSKDLTKAIELPALTVIGEQKSDFTTSQERSRTETFALKEMQNSRTSKKKRRTKSGSSRINLSKSSEVFRLVSGPPIRRTTWQPSGLSESGIRTPVSRHRREGY